MTSAVKKEDKVISILFGWCQTNKHDQCRRETRRFVMEPKGKLVWLDEVCKCSCKRRGCKCYTKPADRVKNTPRRRKK